VTYLSHDGDEFHGRHLGQDFIDFVDRWSLLGCPGNESWQLEPFVAVPGGGIDPTCANAREWRRWFGLRLPGSGLSDPV
jgi:hypothetical protein